MINKKYSNLLFIFFMGLGMSLLMTLIITYINTGYDEDYIDRLLDRNGLGELEPFENNEGLQILRVQ